MYVISPACNVEPSVMTHFLQTMQKLNDIPEFLNAESIQQKSLVKQNRLWEAKLPCNAVLMYDSGNAIDIRVIQNLLPLNKQHERTTKWRQSLMHVQR